jgi:hypothetical protein
VATRIIESLVEQTYQFCLIDPEGDYQNFEGAMVFGGPKAKPVQEEILRLMETPRANAVVCMTGLPIPDRPPFFLSLLAELLEDRSEFGRPHWLVLDEAHHLMPAEWKAPDGILPEQLDNVILITVHPDLLSRTLLERITTVLVVGENALQMLRGLSKSLGQELPEIDDAALKQGEVLLWRRDRDEPLLKVKVDPCKMERQRHSRKYAEGELPPDRSFWFRGPQQKMKLRAQNLILFLQMADGVDDDTWEFHLHNGDYSKWFRESIKDETLAAAAERVEQLENLSPEKSRELIRSAVERDYTLPAAAPLPVPGAS